MQLPFISAAAFGPVPYIVQDIMRKIITVVNSQAYQQVANLVVTNTYVPILGGDATAGTNTYTTQTGEYVRVGNFCVFSAYIVTSAIDAAMAGNLYVTLPVTPRNSLSGPISLGFFKGIILTAGYSQFMIGLKNASNKNANLWQGLNGAGAYTQITPTNLSGTGIIELCYGGTYLVA